MTMTTYIWKELNKYQKKYDVRILWDSKTNIYEVYSKGGKLEFTAEGMQELIHTLHLYYD